MVTGVYCRRSARKGCPGNSEGVHVAAQRYEMLIPFCNPKVLRGLFPPAVVLHGPMGFGKITLVKKLMLEWMEDNLIVDGFDELRVPPRVLIHNICGDWEKQKPVPILFGSLLKRKMVPKAALLVTTQPGTLRELWLLLRVQESNPCRFLDRDILCQDRGSEGCYSFFHLTFQQFLVALFYVQEKEEEDRDRFAWIVGLVQLYSREVRLKNPNLIQSEHFFFGFSNKKRAKELQMTFCCQMSLERKQKLLRCDKDKHSSAMDLKALVLLV
ncbi:hypothetical protein P7K49_030161 [Saguinus oedipus]|uniref:Uncharacterized protein n=1 Tax=Saguinus oedipus TaxID=9490 RepID=A0ABQ9U3F4_SAGOE|nr:hypothetical protein P7K49_030161 [Saguinus oedipus]